MKLRDVHFAAASGLVQTMYLFDGEHRDNSGMYNLVREKNRKYSHCNCCHKNIGVVTDDALKKVTARALEESERTKLSIKLLNKQLNQ